MGARTGRALPQPGASKRYISAQAYLHAMRAEILEEQGQPAKAEEALRLALVYDPDSYVLNLDLARLAFKNASELRVERLVEKAIRAEPKRAGPWLLRGELEARDGRFLQAEQAYQRAFTLEPDTADGARAAIAWAAIAARRSHDAAVSILRPAAQRSAEAAEALRSTLEAAGQLDLAAEVAERAWTLAAEAAPAAAVAVRSWDRAGQFSRAARVIERALIASPDAAGLRVLAVQTELRAGAPERAQAFARALRADDPQMEAIAERYLRHRRYADAAAALAGLRAETAATGLLRAAVLYGQGEVGRAFALAARLARSTGPESLSGATAPAGGFTPGPEALQAIQRSLEWALEQKDPTRARSIAEAAIADADPAKLARIGVLAARVLGPERVLSKLELAIGRAAADPPRALELSSQAAQIEAEQGRAAAGLSRLEALRASGRWPGAALDRFEAELRMTEGAWVRAERLLEKVVVATPEDAGALASLARLRAARGARLLETDALLVRALAQDPDQPALVAARGRVLAILGKGDLGARLLARAAFLDPDDGTTLEHLSEALDRLGKKDEAAAALAAARGRWERDVALGDPSAQARLDRATRRLARSHP